jgi:hypothetical protein
MLQTLRIPTWPSPHQPRAHVVSFACFLWLCKRCVASNPNDSGLRNRAIDRYGKVPFCVTRPPGVSTSRGTIGRRSDRSFERLKKNPSGVPLEKFAAPDVTGEHGVGGMAGLLPDLER